MKSHTFIQGNEKREINKCTKARVMRNRGESVCPGEHGISSEFLKKSLWGSNMLLRKFPNERKSMLLETL